MGDVGHSTFDMFAGMHQLFAGMCNGRKVLYAGLLQKK
jgi:hypothetical protein